MKRTLVLLALVCALVGCDDSADPTKDVFVNPVDSEAGVLRINSRGGYGTYRVEWRNGSDPMVLFSGGVTNELPDFYEIHFTGLAQLTVYSNTTGREICWRLEDLTPTPAIGSAGCVDTWLRQEVIR